MKITDFIGNTPYIPLAKLCHAFGVDACIYAKMEMMNPFGSVKDRAAYNMISKAEEHSTLHPGITILEATSGNMGIALSGIAAAKGYASVVLMPENMPSQRQKIISSLGSQLILTSAEEGMAGARKRAEMLMQTNTNYYYLDQFNNPDNVSAHETYTGPELLKDSRRNIDCIITGVGTGATLTGCARFLKQQVPFLKVIAVEPASSAVLQGKPSGRHTLYGIGAGFVPPLLDFSLIDEVISVRDADAYCMCDVLAKTEGIITGPSSGAVLHAAIQTAKHCSNHIHHMAVILSDSGERYI